MKDEILNKIYRFQKIAKKLSVKPGVAANTLWQTIAFVK